MTIDSTALYIGGSWVAPHSDSRIRVLAASTGELAGSVPEADETDVERAVAAARAAFDDPQGWATWEPARRAAAMQTLHDQLAERQEEIARRVSLQNGMPISIARQLEGPFPLAVLRYFIDLVKTYQFEQSHPHLLGGTTTVRLEPMGVVAAIAPWNFPQSLAMFKIAPALAAGCTIVLKPSPETVLDSLNFLEAVAASDLPPGVINVVPGGRDVGAHLVGHRDVDKVAFTGSTAAGRQIAEMCGRLLRPVTLELGGKSAAIILDDADLDLERIGQDLYGSTLLNNGQTCFLSTRVLAPRSRYDEVVETFAGFMNSLTIGDALDDNTMIGPMATSAHRDRVESYIAKGKAEGATVVTGGGRPDGVGDGWFVEPTLFANVDNAMTIAQEEIFGPVLAVISYDSDDDAIRIANDSDYGLGGTVWTSDPQRGQAVAARVRTGTIGINRYLPDPSSPFGGVKASGIGRELGPDALKAYQQAKSIYGA